MEWTQQIWNRLKSQVAAFREVVAGDFDYGRDYFVGLDFCMALAGVEFKTTSDRLRQWWTVYRVAIYLPLLLIVSNLVMSVVHKEELKIVLSLLAISTAVVLCIGVMFTFVRNYDQLMKVRQYLNQRQFGRDSNSAFLLRSKAFYRFRRIVFGLALCNVFAVGYIWIRKEKFTDLPFNVRDPYPELQFMAEMVRNILFEGPGAMFSLMFSTVYTLLVGMRTELAVIAELFGLIFEKANNRAQLKVESEPDNSKQIHLVTKYYFMKYAHEELRECIKLHQEFLENLNAIRPLLNATFLITYYMATTCTACGVLYLLYVKVFSFYGVLIFYGTLMMFTWCAIFTSFVTKLTEMNESIGEQVYDLDWPMMLECIPQLASEYRSMRSTFLTVMIATQQLLRLNCFGFFEFTQDKFTELVDMAYSLFSFFQNFV